MAKASLLLHILVVVALFFCLTQSVSVSLDLKDHSRRNYAARQQGRLQELVFTGIGAPTPPTEDTSTKKKKKKTTAPTTSEDTSEDPEQEYALENIKETIENILKDRPLLEATESKTSQPSDWRYHITTRWVSTLIQEGGMTSMLARTGEAVAYPSGAFAKNKKLMFDKTCKARLRNILIQVLNKRIAKTDDFQAKFQILVDAKHAADFKPMGLARPDASLNRDNPYGPLEVSFKAYVEDYTGKIATSLPEIKPTKNALKFADIRKAVNAMSEAGVGKEIANVVLKGKLKTIFDDKTHFLTRLAVSYVAYNYLIEEVETASHIYFLKHQYAADGFTKYMGIVGKPDNDGDVDDCVNHNTIYMVVLRVNIEHLPGLEDDMSEGMGEKTMASVEPKNIQICVGNDKEQFKDDTFRADDKNWAPIVGADLTLKDASTKPSGAHPCWTPEPKEKKYFAPAN